MEKGIEELNDRFALRGGEFFHLPEAPPQAAVAHPTGFLRFFPLAATHEAERWLVWTTSASTTSIIFCC